MDHDVLAMIQDSLSRIEHRQDKLAAQVAGIDTRLAVIEAQVRETVELKNQVDSLTAAKNKVLGAKEIAIGVISSAISAAGIWFGVH